MSRRAAALACAVAAALFVTACGRDERVASQIESEEVIEDLSAALGPVGSRVLLRSGERTPRRLGHPATPGVPLRSRLHVPPDASLMVEFGIGIEGAPPPSAPMRFSVRIDGTELFARAVDPATHRHDRQWHARRIDLGPFAGRDVDLALAADLAAPGAPAGTPAWTRLELVRVHRAPRRLATPDAPNVILVLVDTLRADVLGCYGATPSPSPTLDGLAREGLVFEDVVAQAPWTLPSVATLFTGRYPRQHGVTVELADRPQADWDGGTYLPSTIPTLAALLERAGVTTYGVVANALVGPDTGLAAGFEKLELPPARGPGGRRFASGRAVNARFLRWASANRDVRFFAYLHYMEMHSPYAPANPSAPPPDAADAVRAGDATAIGHDVRSGAAPPTAPEVRHLKRLYEESLADWDGMLAELLRDLDALRLRDRTIIVVTADHGEEFLEHGQIAHGKQLFEESLRVPLILVGPGIPRGRRSEPVQLVDLLPTIATRLAAATPPDLVGRDVVAPLPAIRPAFAEIRSGVGFGQADLTIAMVREPPWKLIWAPGGDRVALFHLGADPEEREPRAADADVAARLLAIGRAYWSEPALAAPPTAAPDLTNKLRHLGYIE